MGQKGAWPKSRDLLFKFCDRLISPERLKIQTANFARGLKVRDRILYKKCKTSQNGALPRSRATSRSRDILNILATEALKNGKIRESIAFDFQHGYQMWT